MKDLTILYYTSNTISDYFMKNTQDQLLKAVGDTPIVSVSFKPTVVGDNCKNICIGEQPRSSYMIYKQVLLAVREAKTEYVATAEDDVLYPKEHFEFRPPKDTLAYDVNKWSIFTWTNPPIFSIRERKTMTSLIAPREELLKTLEERYEKYPEWEPERFARYWAEPGRFEDHLRIKKPKTMEYKCSVPSIVFSTKEALAFSHLGTRKAHSLIKKDFIEPWGSAEEILQLYK